MRSIGAHTSFVAEVASGGSATTSGVDGCEGGPSGDSGNVSVVGTALASVLSTVDKMSAKVIDNVTTVILCKPPV